MGSIVNVRWIHNGIVATGPYCTAQGIIQQFGVDGVGMSFLVCLILLMSLDLRATTDTHLVAPASRSPHIRVCSVASRIKITPLCCWHDFPYILFCYAVGRHWASHPQALRNPYSC